MKFNEYQLLAQRTSNKALTQREHVRNAALGLCGEAGEVADILKKHKMQGHDENVPKIIEELGDVMWYVAEAATHTKARVNWDYVYKNLHNESTDDTIIHLAVTLCKTAGVAGEKMINGRKATRELCEVLYICRLIADYYGFTIIEVGERNIAKLMMRFPDGFDTDKSVHREE